VLETLGIHQKRADQGKSEYNSIHLCCILQSIVARWSLEGMLGQAPRGTWHKPTLCTMFGDLLTIGLDPASRLLNMAECGLLEIARLQLNELCFFSCYWGFALDALISRKLPRVTHGSWSLLLRTRVSRPTPKEACRDCTRDGQTSFRVAEAFQALKVALIQMYPSQWILSLGLHPAGACSLLIYTISLADRIRILGFICNLACIHEDDRVSITGLVSALIVLGPLFLNSPLIFIFAVLIGVSSQT